MGSSGSWDVGVSQNPTCNLQMLHPQEMMKMGRTWLKTQVRLEPRRTELVGAGMPLVVIGEHGCRWVDQDQCSQEQGGGRLVCGDIGFDSGGKGHHRCEASQGWSSDCC